MATTSLGVVPVFGIRVFLPGPCGSAKAARNMKHKKDFAVVLLEAIARSYSRNIRTYPSASSATLPEREYLVTSALHPQSAVLGRCNQRQMPLRDLPSWLTTCLRSTKSQGEWAGSAGTVGGSEMATFRIRLLSRASDILSFLPFLKI